MADFRGGRVLRRDPDTGRKQASVRLTLPKPIILADPDSPPDSDFLPSNIATGAGGVWVSTARGYVARIDPDTNRVTAYVRTKFDSTSDVAAGDGAVWVGEGNHLGRIDARTQDVSHIKLVGPNGVRIGIGPVALCQNAVRVLGGVTRPTTDETGHRTYTFTKHQEAVAEIDPLTSTVLTVRRVSKSPRSLCKPPVEAATRQVTRARCEEGEPPGYYVPHDANLGPVVRVICARLPVSRKRVDFSGTRGRISAETDSCLHAAYAAGERQTATCANVPPLSEYAVRGIGDARREWGDYGYVIWGSVGGSVSAVQLRYAGGYTSATVFRVGEELARRFGEQRFGVWVAELPLAAACGTVVIKPYYGAPVRRLRPRPAKCKRA
ncbi:MAG: hypothetical protein WKF94_02245 [Solirubrobacteraceae bacterium]